MRDVIGKRGTDFKLDGGFDATTNSEQTVDFCENHTQICKDH